MRRIRFVNVFPARAGMNRPSSGAAWASLRISRASGDEPGAEGVIEHFNAYFPRERG